MPVPNLAYHLNNWTRMEVYQQGLTADVSCEVTSKQDPTFNVSQETGNIFNTQYQKITLSCNGTSDSSGVMLNSTLDPDNIIPAAGDSYLFFTICPYMNPDAPRNTFSTTFLALNTHTILTLNGSCVYASFNRRDCNVQHGLHYQTPAPERYRYI
jgi:hypothetical protein